MTVHPPLKHAMEVTKLNPRTLASSNRVKPWHSSLRSKCTISYSGISLFLIPQAKAHSKSYQSITASGYLQTRGFCGFKTEAANGVGLQMNLLLFNTRHSRVRASTMSAVARFDGRYRPFGTKEAIHRCSPELWFVKVVCTLLVRSHFCLDSCLGYLSQNLTPLTSFEVITRLDNPRLAVRFLEFSRVNLSLIHSFKTYHLLLRSLCESGLHDVAKVVFDYMRSDGHLPNSSMIEFLVLSFTKVGKFDFVKELLSQLPSEKIAMDTFTSNSLLNWLVKQNKVNEAIFLFKEHFRLYSRPDTWTFNIMIRGLCRIGKVNKAFEIFCNMESFGCSPDVVTYNTLINGFCRVNEVDRGHWLLKEVKLRDEISPNAVTYTSVILGYCKLGKMEEASCIRDEMINSGIQPTAVTFNILIDGFGKVKMGLKLWDEMNAKNISPNVYTFAILINALCKDNRLDEARRFLSQLKCRDIVPKPFMYNPVIDGLCKAGNIDEANAVVAEMEEKRCKPDKVTFTILIIGHCMKGRMLEAISIFNKKVTIGCGPD
ncbi:pentatricopeptide repeat-containing protein At2g06000-like, partial [Pistacia vera]|uniref:pentatricopeptide repeat-containing protein At2g06000-like n=1 Tax=Pistacia vera TaxID=55513 RepID=UPI00126317AC